MTFTNLNPIPKIIAYILAVAYIVTTCSCLKIGSPIPATESKFKLRKAEESNLKVQANLRDIKSANVELRRNVKEIEQIVARQAQVESQIMAKVGRLK